MLRESQRLGDASTCQGTLKSARKPPEASIEKHGRDPPPQPSE